MRHRISEIRRCDIRRASFTYIYAFVGCPAVPEEGDWDEEGEEYTGWETHFGLEDAVVGFGHPDYGCV
jgi:hypothetical protein